MGRARFHVYPSHHVELSQLLAKRIDGYVKFVRLIHNVIYRMQLAIRDIKAAPAFKLQHPELPIPDIIIHAQPPHYPDEQYAYLPLKVTHGQLQAFLLQSKPVTAGLSHLLLHCPCAHVVDRPGLTWHELLLIISGLHTPTTVNH